MDGGGNTELLGDIDVAAPRALSDITRVPNQGFKDMVAGLAMVFVNRHKVKAPMRVVWVGGSTTIVSTGLEQRYTGGSCCTQVIVKSFWAAQEALSMLAGSG